MKSKYREIKDEMSKVVYPTTQQIKHGIYSVSVMVTVIVIFTFLLNLIYSNGMLWVLK